MENLVSIFCKVLSTRYTAFFLKEQSIDTYFWELKDIPASCTEPTNVVHITEGTLRPPIHPHSLTEEFLQIYRRTW
jgi:hypothetical protein